MKILCMSLLMSIAGIALFKVYLDTFLSGSGRMIRRLAGWIPFFVWQVLSEISCFSEKITLPLTFVTIFLVGFIAYTGSWWKKFAFPVIYLFIWMLLEGVAASCVGLGIREADPDFFMVSSVSKILLFPIVLGIRRFAKKEGISKEPYSGSIYLLILPIVGMVLYNTMYHLLHRTSSNRLEVGGWLLLVSFALIFLSLYFYPSYVRLVRDLYIKKNAQFYKKQMELYIEEKELEETAITEIRELHHDMKQKLIYIQGIAQKGDLAAIQCALTEAIGETVESGKLESATGNTAVDSLINHAWKVALKEGIDFHGDIPCGLPELSITHADLCVLLGNALDNALEASRHILPGHKNIWVSLEYSDGYLLLQVANCYEGDVKQSSDGRIVSRKKEKGHGLGLYSMEKIVHKYHGAMTVKPGEDIFTVRILIYC